MDILIAAVFAALCFSVFGGTVFGLVVIPALIRWLEKRGY